jgi:hypothetical protein
MKVEVEKENNVQHVSSGNICISIFQLHFFSLIHEPFGREYVFFCIPQAILIMLIMIHIYYIMTLILEHVL